MMKKFLRMLSIAMALVMCFTMVFTTAVSAEGTTPAITLGDAQTALAGATVTIPVTAEGFAAAGIVGAEFNVNLGDLVYVSDDAVVDGEAVANYADGVVRYADVPGDVEDGIVAAYADGTIFTITATIPEDAETDATYTVTVTDVVAGTSAEEEVEVTGGEVVITVGSAETPIDNNIVITPSIEVGQQLGVSYLFTTAQLASYDHCELVVIPTKYSTTTVGSKIAYNEYVAEPIVYADTTWTVSGKYKYVSYQGIAMFELGLNVEAYLNCYDAEGNLVAKSNTVSDTPATFLKATYKTVYSSAVENRVNMKIAIAELLVMGGNAQRYFQTRATDDCDLAAVTTYVDADDANYNYVASEFSNTEITGLNTVNSTEWAEEGAALTSSNTTFMKAVGLAGAPAVSYMLKSTAITDPSKLTMELSYTSLYPTEEVISETVTGDMWTVSGSWYMFDFTKTRLYDGNKDITAKVYYDGKLVFTDTYSVESYVGSDAVLNHSNTALADTCAAVCRFGIAIRNFFVGS